MEWRNLRSWVVALGVAPALVLSPCAAWTADTDPLPECGFYTEWVDFPGTEFRPSQSKKFLLAVRARAINDPDKGAGNGLLPYRAEDVSFAVGPAALGTVTDVSSELISWRCEEPSEERDRWCGGGIEFTYRAGQEEGVDLVPLRLSSAHCGRIQGVLDFRISGQREYELEIGAREGVAEGRWLGTFSMADDGTVAGSGSSMISIDGKCISSLTLEKWRISRSPDNVGDEEKLWLTIVDVQTVYDVDNVDELATNPDPTCLLGSLVELGQATALSTGRLFANLAAAAPTDGNQGMVDNLSRVWEISLPIAGRQVRTDVTGKWEFTVRPLR